MIRDNKEQEGNGQGRHNRRSALAVPLLAFFIPAAVMIAAYIFRGVWPFGDQCEMIIDSYHQYVPFFSEFQYKIRHGESLLYSWHGSLGYNFWSVLAYYLASPLNILIPIFAHEYMIQVFQLLIVLKIALCSLTCSIYLSSKSRQNAVCAVFSSFYALGGFMIAYNWNVMWLDCVYLLPLVVLGAEKLIREGDGRLYTVTLGLTILSNYYIAIMVLIYLVLYFFVCWFAQPGSEKGNWVLFVQRGIRYFLCSVLALGLAAVCLLPTVYTMANSSTGSPPSHWELYRSFLDLFARQFAMLEPTQLTGPPNIYCGVCIFLLAVFYLGASNIPMRERVLKILLAVFLFISLNVNVLNYVWHGLHFPNNLPGRFSFLYIFLLVGMAWEAYLALPGMNRLFMAGAACAGIIWYILVLVFVKEDLSLEAKVVTGILAGAGLLFFFARRLLQAQARSAFLVSAFLAAIMIVELFANTIYGINENGSVTIPTYMAKTAQMETIRRRYQPEDTFYRMESAQILGRDDIVRYNMNGLSFFSSTCDDRMEKLMGSLGFYKAGNKYSYKGATPLTDAMLGIRYVISDKELPSFHLKETDKIDNLLVYENRFCLPLGFEVDEDIRDWAVEEGDPFQTQNDFAYLAGGAQEDIFEMLPAPEPEIEKGTITSSGDDLWRYEADTADTSVRFDLDFETTQDVYLYFEASHCDELKVTKDGQEQKYSDERGHIVHLGECGKDTEVILRFPLKESDKSGSIVLQLAAFNEEVFEDVMDSLSQSTLEITSMNGPSHLSGTILAQDDGILLLSLPYDEGWTIRIDGQPAETFITGNALTGMYLDSGFHTFHMDYRPQGFLPGLILSILSFLILLLIWRTGLLKGNGIRVSVPVQEDILPENSDSEQQENDALEQSYLQSESL